MSFSFFSFLSFPVDFFESQGSRAEIFRNIIRSGGSGLHAARYAWNGHRSLPLYFRERFLRTRIAFFLFVRFSPRNFLNKGKIRFSSKQIRTDCFSSIEDLHRKVLFCEKLAEVSFSILVRNFKIFVTFNSCISIASPSRF